jgi:predicted dehydrogenase
MTPFRFVLLGTGFMARLWMKTMQAREDCEVVGIASRRDLPEELYRDFGIARVTLGMEDFSRPASSLWKGISPKFILPFS